MIAIARERKTTTEGAVLPFPDKYQLASSNQSYALLGERSSHSNITKIVKRDRGLLRFITDVKYLAAVDNMEVEYKRVRFGKNVVTLLRLLDKFDIEISQLYGLIEAYDTLVRYSDKTIAHCELEGELILNLSQMIGIAEHYQLSTELLKLAHLRRFELMMEAESIPYTYLCES